MTLAVPVTAGLDLSAGHALQSLLHTTTPCGPVLVPGDPHSNVLAGKRPKDGFIAPTL